MSTPIYRYVGEGERFHGVPPTDLTREQFDALSPQLQRDVRAGTLYEPVTKAAQAEVRRQQQAGDAGQEGDD